MFERKTFAIEHSVISVTGQANVRAVTFNRNVGPLLVDLRERIPGGSIVDVRERTLGSGYQAILGTLGVCPDFVFVCCLQQSCHLSDRTTTHGQAATEASHYSKCSHLVIFTIQKQ